ncbi:hypothetical protein F5051DRAFT_304084, partial [Lentinula edodes]
LSFDQIHENTTLLPCKLCGQQCKLSEMRDHVGGHILRWMRDSADTLIIENDQQVGADPCGWCGMEGCITSLGKKSPKAKMLRSASDCPYHFANMSWANAKKVTPSSPSTNIPIICQLCEPNLTIWKYNTAYHLVSHHSE